MTSQNSFKPFRHNHLQNSFCRHSNESNLKQIQKNVMKEIKFNKNQERQLSDSITFSNLIQQFIGKENVEEKEINRFSLNKVKSTKYQTSKKQSVFEKQYQNTGGSELQMSKHRQSNQLRQPKVQKVNLKQLQILSTQKKQKCRKEALEKGNQNIHLGLNHSRKSKKQPLIIDIEIPQDICNQYQINNNQKRQRNLNKQHVQREQKKQVHKNLKYNKSKHYQKQDLKKQNKSISKRTNSKDSIPEKTFSNKKYEYKYSYKPTPFVQSFDTVKQSYPQKVTVDQQVTVNLQQPELILQKQAIKQIKNDLKRLVKMMSFVNE